LSFNYDLEKGEQEFASKEKKGKVGAGTNISTVLSNVIG